MHQFKDAYCNIWKRLYKEYRACSYMSIYLYILQARKFQATNNTKIFEYFDQHSRISLKVPAFLNHLINIYEMLSFA